MTAPPPWPPPLLRDWKHAVRAKDPPRWLIPKLVPADALVQISGPPKLAKKTLFTMALGRVISTGREVPGLTLGREFKGNPVPALFMEYEGPEWSLADSWDWLDNAAGWAASEEGDIYWAHQYSHMRLTDPLEAAKVRRLIADNGIKMVVVDTMVRAASAPENDPQAMDSVLDVFGSLKKATNGGVVIYIHHLRKSYGIDDWDEDIDATVRGSSALGGGYDQHLAFRQGFHPDSVHLFTRSKVDEERFFRVRWEISEEQQRAGFTIAELPARKPPPDDLVSLAEDLIEGTNVMTLRQLAQTWDFPRPVAENMAMHMVAQGVLHRTAKGFKRGG